MQKEQSAREYYHFREFGSTPILDSWVAVCLSDGIHWETLDLKAHDLIIAGKFTGVAIISNSKEYLWRHLRMMADVRWRYTPPYELNERL